MCRRPSSEAHDIRLERAWGMILPGFLLCARHGVDLGNESSLRAVMTGTVSRRQLRHREVGWEGSRRRNPERTNRNRVAGRRGGITRQWTGMLDSHPDTHVGKFGSIKRWASTEPYTDPNELKRYVEGCERLVYRSNRQAHSWSTVSQRFLEPARIADWRFFQRVPAGCSKPEVQHGPRNVRFWG